MPTLKQQLHKLCEEYIAANIKNAESVIADATEASHNETKSSSGDKFETAREMMQQDINLNKTRLSTAKAQKNILNSISTEQSFTTAAPGCIVLTNHGNFYISVSAGKLLVDGVSYYAISIESPIGLQLRGKQTGDTFSLNGKEYQVKSII